MTFQLPSMCDSCANKETEENVCTAFPDGIPDKYTLGGFPHVDPDVDGGVVWNLRKGDEWRLTQYLSFWHEPGDQGD